MTIGEKINFDISERINDLHKLQTDENDCLCVCPSNASLISDLASMAKKLNKDVGTVVWTLEQLGYHEQVIEHFKSVYDSVK